MLFLDDIRGHALQKKRIHLLFRGETMPQVVLFSGMPGIGKRTLALRIGASLFCSGDQVSCACPSCRQIAAGVFPDFISLVPNEKGTIPIGSEEKREPGSVRWLIERLSRQSISGKTFALVDGLECLTEEGQNALLKTIEEPAEHTVLCLISGNRSRLLPTIISRCFELRFNPLDAATVAELLIRQGMHKVESEFLSRISGGSIEIAMVLANREQFRQVMDIGGAIASFFRNDVPFDADFESAQKKLPVHLLLDVLLSIYRYNLHAVYGNSLPEDRERLQALWMDDGETVSSVIKILLALKRGREHNLNLRLSLKGLLYAHRNPVRGVPFAGTNAWGTSY